MQITGNLHNLEVLKLDYDAFCVEKSGTNDLGSVGSHIWHLISLKLFSGVPALSNFQPSEPKANCKSAT